MALTQQERNEIATRVACAMRDAYEADGEDGDFEGAFWYLANDVDDEELLDEEKKWCKEV